MDYSQFLSAVAINCATDTSDDSLIATLPAAIDYVEGRIYRDPAFNFLNLNTEDYATCVVGNRAIAKPESVLIVEGVNVLTPAGTQATSTNVQRTPLQRVSMWFLDQVWGSGGNYQCSSGLPESYAPLSETSFRIGPVPNAAYVMEFKGPTRPKPLSQNNRTTFLSLNMPELYVAGAMVYLCGGFLKNFGAQSDNPQQAQSWENQFNLLKTGPAIEEARRKSESASWQPRPPTMAANPPR